MRKLRKRIFAVLMMICMIMTTVFAVPTTSGTVEAAETTSETFIQNGFYLTIVQTVGNTVDKQVIDQIKEIYFKQYPKMRARYNPSRPRSITMVFDPGYDGVAYTMGTKIVYSVNYLKANPKDSDCATHELFHVVQGGYKNYGSSKFATAFCEGVADYARSVYGLYNKEGGWSLPDYSSNQAYTDSYRITARFLTWVQQTVDSSIIYNINKTMHAGTYTDDLWVQMTGKTVDQLWSEYAANPDINKIGFSGQKTESFGINQGETYKIISSESGMALSVKDGSTADGANIQQENYTGDTSQQWEFKYLGDGMYNIINKKSGKGLDVADGSTSNGANIQQYSVENGGNNNQKWIVYERGSEYTLLPVCGNGTMVADLASSSHNAGANIQLYTWNKSKAQSFIIESLSSPSEEDYTLKALDRVEAEDFITCSPDIGVSVDESDARSRGANIGGLLAGAWTQYYGVVFDKDAGSIEINYCNPSGDSYVNVYVDNMNGTPVGTIQTPHNSSDWNTYTSVTGELTRKIPAGTHDIYLEFKNNSMAGYAQNCDYFRFIEKEKVPFDGFSKIEAEDFTDDYGVVIDNNSEGEPQNIGGTHNGDWVQYDNVVFAEDAGTIELNYSCQQGSGGQVYVYADSMNSTPAAIIDISPTGSNWSNYETITAELDNVIDAGSHTIYLKFVNGGGNVVNIDWFKFLKYVGPVNGIVISGDIKVEGYQIGTALGGNRVVGSVEPEIGGKKVKNWGFIYGLSKANGKDYGITADDMYVGGEKENEYVKTYQSTSIGTSSVKLGDSSTATYFIRTMLFSSFTANAFNAEYKVRAYALLENGKYVYSEVADYSIFRVADYLYTNKLMNTIETHQYLYNNILKVVDEKYSVVDYEWNNSIVKPGEAE